MAKLYKVFCTKLLLMVVARVILWKSQVNNLKLHCFPHYFQKSKCWFSCIYRGWRPELFILVILIVYVKAGSLSALWNVSCFKLESVLTLWSMLLVLTVICRRPICQLVTRPIIPEEAMSIHEISDLGAREGISVQYVPHARPEARGSSPAELDWATSKNMVPKQKDENEENE